MTKKVNDKKGKLMISSSFTQEELEKVNPLLKRMRERHEKMQHSRGIPNNKEQLKQVQQNIQEAYHLLELPDEIFQAAHPSIANRYLSSLEKLRVDRDSLLNALTCQAAALPLKQFQGKSKMVLALLKALDAEIDQPLFDKLVGHSFPHP